MNIAIYITASVALLCALPYILGFIGGIIIAVATGLTNLFHHKYTMEDIFTQFLPAAFCVSIMVLILLLGIKAWTTQPSQDPELEQAIREAIEQVLTERSSK